MFPHDRVKGSTRRGSNLPGVCNSCMQLESSKMRGILWENLVCLAFLKEFPNFLQLGAFLNMRYFVVVVDSTYAVRWHFSADEGF